MLKPFFSKTSYLKGRQCYLALYLYKYHYSSRDPLPPERKARFETGHLTGLKARQLYPGGVDASPVKVNAYRESVELTHELISKGVGVIYEAAFLHNRVLVYCDLLIKAGDGWKLAEVKSSDYLSDIYKEDIALQYYVLKGSGIPISSAVIIHLRKKVSDTDFSSPLQEIFIEKDIMEYCESSVPAIAREIEKMKWILASPSLPDIAMGPQCDNPYPCDFKGFCHSRQQYPVNGLFQPDTNSHE